MGTCASQERPRASDGRVVEVYTPCLSLNAGRRFEAAAVPKASYNSPVKLGAVGSCAERFYPRSANKHYLACGVGLVQLARDVTTSIASASDQLLLILHVFSMLSLAVCGHPAQTLTWIWVFCVGRIGRWG